MIYYRDGEYHEGGIELDVAGEAFRYGFGIFETLYWDGEAVCRLPEHAARALSSLDALGAHAAPCDFASVVPEVAHRAGLAGRPGRVNLLFPVEGGTARPVVTAAPYEPPAQGKTLALALSPRPFHSWLGVHKTVNYLYYHLEHQAALAQGFDGAAITEPGGHLLEAATAALVFADHGRLITPAPPGVGDTAPGILRSVALGCVADRLEIIPRRIRVEDLGGFNYAWALNSLMGMVPVTGLGEVRFKPEFSPCDTARGLILRP